MENREIGSVDSRSGAIEQSRLTGLADLLLLAAPRANIVTI
jgi:hypothetical protein